MRSKFSIITLVAVFAVMFVTSLSAQTAADLKLIEGKWKYSMPNMDGDLMDGTCVIATVDGVTKATFTTPMGELTSSPLKYENGKYSGTLSVESDMGSFSMNVSLEPKEGKLMYGISSDFGEFPPIEMTRI